MLIVLHCLEFLVRMAVECAAHEIEREDISNFETGTKRLKENCYRTNTNNPLIQFLTQDIKTIGGSVYKQISENWRKRDISYRDKTSNNYDIKTTKNIFTWNIIKCWPTLLTDIFVRRFTVFCVLLCMNPARRTNILFVCADCIFKLELIKLRDPEKISNSDFYVVFQAYRLSQVKFYLILFPKFCFCISFYCQKFIIPTYWIINWA